MDENRDDMTDEVLDTDLVRVKREECTSAAVCVFIQLSDETNVASMRLLSCVVTNSF